MKKEVIILILLISITQISAADDQGTVIVDIPVTTDCTLDLKEGWNLFSFCSNLNNPDLLTVLNQIDGKYDFVMEWDSITQDFKIYSTKATQKPFTVFNDDFSYFIYMTEDASLDISGEDVLSEERNLIAGWNTPAYQYKFSTFITDIISEIMNEFVFLMKWNTANQEFDIYSEKSTIHPFDEIFPGEGRFIYLENSGTITT